MTDNSTYPCPRCQIGFCRPSQQTYLRVHQGQLLSVRGMPVWTCDICYFQEFDHRAVERVEALMSAGPHRKGSSKKSATSVRRVKP